MSQGSALDGGAAVAAAGVAGVAGVAADAVSVPGSLAIAAA